MIDIDDIKLEDDKYYILSPYGLGDTMFLCSFKEAFEQKNGGKAHFLMKPSHEFIMKMYGITDYTVCDTAKLKVIKYSTTFEKGKIALAHFSHIENGENCLKSDNFMQAYIKLLGLSEDTKFQQPIWYPKLSEEFKKKIEAINSLDNIVLICPEASSNKMFNKTIWEKEIERAINDGYKVICNIVDINNQPKNSIYVPMTTEEAIALAINCKKVISIRSGICDIIYFKCQDLKVLYNNYNKFYYLSNMYSNINPNVKDVVIKHNIFYKDFVKTLYFKYQSLKGLYNRYK
ncbi:MAG: hypothetical protein LBJ88_01465 [Campylobacteraceae bacterium]|jgi:hypothetical protein|nr:hypothetical protein [Campylobacteraceae bacterium]